MAKITGLGGVFLDLKIDVNKMLNWYKEKLSLDISEFGINFLEPNTFTLITFKREKHGAFLNFTVDNLEDFIEEIRLKGVNIIQEIKEEEFGKLAKVTDLYDNVIEFWQPYEAEYIDMVKTEINEHSI